MFESFINALRNLWQVPELRKRVIFTLLMLVVYRAGIHIPVPGIDQETLKQVWGSAAGTLFGVLDLFSGGNLRRISIFALGIMPYITALKKIQEEGELGRRKITQYTRYLTVALCLVQGTAIVTWLNRQPGLVNFSNKWGFIFLGVLTLMTGTMFIMWIGEQITERGLGNGISLLIFAGIIVNLPNAIQQLYGTIKDPGSVCDYSSSRNDLNYGRRGIC
jgi:preprotein translocase subunit SecY